MTDPIVSGGPHNTDHDSTRDIVENPVFFGISEETAAECDPMADGLSAVEVGVRERSLHEQFGCHGNGLRHVPLLQHAAAYFCSDAQLGRSGLELIGLLISMC